ncbi:hypothetical protein QBC35DRAFT_476333 [Podospora australis]|uniref:Uncharacterized protein n=1 Tax=Podospora australis TaxID=1536484 RepID=A0AAN6WNK3_9PEZI|nr:hypothetical protein QBC35DRAFT_476333 [Podospora australis]
MASPNSQPQGVSNPPGTETLPVERTTAPSSSSLPTSDSPVWDYKCMYKYQPPLGPGLLSVRMYALGVSPKALEEILEKYCPPHLRAQARADPANRHCLPRAYFGSIETPRVPQVTRGPSFFSLGDFRLDLNRLLLMFGPDDITITARQMGTGLATLHWERKSDALGVAFALGLYPIRIPKTSASSSAAVATTAHTSTTSPSPSSSKH